MQFPQAHQVVAKSDQIKNINKNLNQVIVHQVSFRTTLL